MNTYSEYKDSGIDWIGKIPKSWQVKKLKFNTYIKGRIGWQALKTDEFVDEGPYCVTGTDFKEGKINWETCYHVGEERWAMDKFIQLKEKDLVITKDGTIGKIAIVKNLNGKACLNSGVFVTRPKNDDYITEYMYWVLNSTIFTEFINFEKKGTTISHLYQNVFENLPYPNPTIKEQEKIISFLKQKVTSLNNLIQKKKKLSNLLFEQKIGILNRAVIQGLNKNIELKGVNYEFPSKIPKHWNIMPFRRICNLNQGLQIAQSQRFDITGENRFIYITIKYLNSDLSEINSDYIENPPTSVICKKTDVLMARTGGTGEVVTNAEGVFHNNFFRINYDKNKIERDYLVYYLKTDWIKKMLLLKAGVTTVPDLNHGDFLSTPVVIPPVSEQKEIVKFLDQETLQIDKSIDKIQKEIELLEEYKDALISEAVTGKINVSEALS
jgi:type I restriction enzyme, S subunit